VIDVTGTVHDLAKEVIGTVMVAACTWLGGRVRKAVRDLNCYFQRQRDHEECAVAATSFEDYQARMKQKIAERQARQSQNQ
jgi:hypothetical protein